MKFITTTACALLLTTSILNCNETNAPKPDYSWKTHAACGAAKAFGLIPTIFGALLCAEGTFCASPKRLDTSMFIACLSGTATIGYSAWSSFKKAYGLYRKTDTKKA